MMDRILTNKWSVRIISLIFAAILFTSVTATSTSVTNVTDGVYVDVINNVPVEVYYDKDNMNVTGVPDTVDVTVSGPKGLVQLAKTQPNIIAYIDLTNAKAGTQSVKIKVKNLSDRLKATVNPPTAKVTLAEKMTKKYSVDVELNKSVIADGYQAGTAKTDPKKVSITASKEILDQIAYVKATVSDEKDQKSDFTTKATISAFDANLNKLDVEIDPGEVGVDVPVSKIGKTVPLRFQQSGNPADKTVTITSITSDDEKVTVIAPESVTDKIEQITIPIDVTQTTADKTIEVSVPVPTGATSVTPATVKVKITTGKKQSDQSSNGASEGTGQTSEESPDVTTPDTGTDTETDKDKEEDKTDTEDTTKQSSTEFTDIPISIIGLVNSESFNTAFIDPASGKVNITISGQKKEVDALGRNDFNVVAVMSNLQDGTHTIPLAVHGLASNFTFTLSQSKAEIQVTKKVAEASAPVLN
ncbi:CdaR family protein [Listeria newyorkensis]|uniref:YbbR-like domain-containing protein n=1 Tax=Listeria newyorkensis TaxID=1497681 RepID=A0A841YYN0_9LIST|nr:CdaR family protein [Listeria newyorkensis]MBC1458199.1 YbbR-like domain-containing protein [Listeria newyorkensis]